MSHYCSIKNKSLHFFWLTFLIVDIQSRISGRCHHPRYLDALNSSSARFIFYNFVTKIFEHFLSDCFLTCSTRADFLALRAFLPSRVPSDSLSRPACFLKRASLAVQIDATLGEKVGSDDDNDDDGNDDNDDGDDGNGPDRYFFAREAKTIVRSHYRRRRRRRRGRRNRCSCPIDGQASDSH